MRKNELTSNIQQRETGNYNRIGLDDNLRPLDSLDGKQEYDMSVDWDMKRERTPYMNPTQLSKGVIKQNFGGRTTFYDTTGGTIIFDYDPATGTITLGGPVVLDYTVVNGTLVSPVFQGTVSVSQLITGGTLGTFVGGKTTGGTYLAPGLGTPTMSYPTISGSITQSIGTSTGTVYFRDNGGTPELVASYGTINYRFAPAGTF